MTKFHLFAGDRFYPEGGTNDYKGAFDTLEQAYDVAKGNDWSELAVINDAGVLEHYAHRDEKVVDAGDGKRARWIGWVVGDSLAIMEIKTEAWVDNTPAPTGGLQATGYFPAGYWSAGGGL